MMPEHRQYHVMRPRVFTSWAQNLALKEHHHATTSCDATWVDKPLSSFIAWQCQIVKVKRFNRPTNSPSARICHRPKKLHQWHIRTRETLTHIIVTVLMWPCYTTNNLFHMNVWSKRHVPSEILGHPSSSHCSTFAFHPLLPHLTPIEMLLR
jgi:hypothetical protein